MFLYIKMKFNSQHYLATCSENHRHLWRSGSPIYKTGAMLIRNIVLPFDEYFKKMQNQKAFSKTV
jgi:hypothetical protein